MNTLHSYPHEFESWWNNLDHKPGDRKATQQGWKDCFLERHNIHNRGAKLRGSDPYCTGWNAAVEFILRQDNNKDSSHTNW